MMSMFDRYIIRRLFTTTVFVLGVLIFIFIVLDFSENSDDFTDQGATFQAIWNEYYLNYIPEMIRLVMPMAIFTACLFLTGQLSERLEITALKAAGISLYRLFAPYLAFAITMAVVVSALDSYIIPKSNQKRIAFEDQYIKKKNEKIDRSEIYRQPTPNSILRINFFDGRKNIGYQIRMIEFEGKEVS
ncbi:MAG: LptF/LptG family permease, partial [Bacteroidota bacterium]